MTDIAVIGGGLAGLGGASAMRQAGLNPVVFEANDYPGGRAPENKGLITVTSLDDWSRASLETPDAALRSGQRNARYLIQKFT